jgi:hypothetical protein
MNEPSEACAVGLGSGPNIAPHRAKKGPLRLVRPSVHTSKDRRVDTEVLLDRTPPGVLDRSAPMDDEGDRGRPPSVECLRRTQASVHAARDVFRVGDASKTGTGRMEN